MTKSLFVLALLLVVLSGCAGEPEKTPIGGSEPEEGISMSFCGECADSDPATIDFCKMRGSEFVSCEFLPRCGELEFSDGKCLGASLCGNRVCEAGESDSCPDCFEREKCSNGGFTGKSVAPRNLFEWNFKAVSGGMCDSHNPDGFNCDALQATIALLSKLEIARNYLEKEGIPSGEIELEGVGSLNPTENGVEMGFGFALLSDNYASKEFFKDFAKKLEEEQGALSELSAPVWTKDWLPFLYSAGTDEDPLLKVDYRDFFAKRMDEKIFPQGDYGVKVKVDFGGQQGFFMPSVGKSVPGAKIVVEMEKLGRLSGVAVIDLALDGKLGVDNPQRDYGIRWPLASPPIGLSSTGPSGETRFDSGIYKNGANEILGVDPVFSPITKEPSYFDPPYSVGNAFQSKDVFFANAPVLFQTITEWGSAFPSRLVFDPDTQEEIWDKKPGEIVEGFQTFAVFNPTVPVPLVALVSPSSTAVFGTAGLSENYALPQDWFKAAELAQGEQTCGNFEVLDAGPQIESLCGDADPRLFKEAFGEEFDFSQEEILKNYPSGLVIHNPSNMARLYLNIAFVPVADYLEPPTLQSCNSKGEVSTPWQTVSSAFSPLVLYNEQLKIETLKDLVEGIRQEKVCVYTQFFENEPLVENGVAAETFVEKTSYLWNVDKIAGEVYPKLYNYRANPAFGVMQNCS